MNILKKWGPLFVLGLALAIIIIDTTLLNVSLSTIIREFHTSIESLQWVITTYSLTLASLTITGGRLGDIFGRKKMFVGGALLFAVGSFIASISSSVPMLLLGESIIEGIGASLMMPATASLLVSTYKGRERALAFGIWGGLAGASSAIGPILGGYLTNNFSWRWGFRINVFVVILLVLGAFFISEYRETDRKTTLDIPGVFLAGVALLSIVFAVIQSSSYGWWEVKDTFSLGGIQLTPFGLSIVPFALLAGFILLGVFLVWEYKTEQRGKTPLISLGVFSNKVFVSGVVTTAIITLGQVGMIFCLPIFLQSVLKLDAFRTGLALLPLSITMLVMAPLSGILSGKLSPKLLILTGLIFDFMGVWVLRASISPETQVLHLAPGLILFGIGMGMVMAQISNLTLSALPVQQAGEASGINNTMRQIGSTLGTSLIGAALLATLTTQLAANVQKSRVIPSAIRTSIAQSVSKNAANIEFGGTSQFESTLPSSIVREITRISNQATVDSVRHAFLYTAGFILVAFFVGLTLPNKRKVPPSVETISGH
jgi:EmrB/QacA subfamily drug resistance transporter